MKKIILTAAIAMIAMGAMAQKTMEKTYENYIQVTGKAEREITPDQI